MNIVGIGMKNLALIAVLGIAAALGLGFLSGQMADLPKTGNALSSSKSIYDIYLCGNDASCMDDIAEELLKVKNAEELLAELDELGKRNSDVLYQCHPVTHAIGRMLYKKLLQEGGHLGDTFQECDHTCHSGCFHGAMERVFFTEDALGTPHVTQKILMEKVPQVCEIFGYGTEGNIKFQCLHGLGHAVLFFMDYNLTESLDICDTLPTTWDQTSCYGGMFMENIFASNKSARYLNDDPHFPCNAIEEKYRKECYIMQTSRMFELGLAPEETGKECENAGDYRHHCMQSIGRDLSGNARTDPKSVTICTNLTATTYNQYCITGVIYALADNSWDGRYAFPYCDSLPSDYTEYCYKTVINYLRSSIFISKSAITSSCEAHSSYINCKNLTLA